MKAIIKKTGAIGNVLGRIDDAGQIKVVFENGLVLPWDDVQMILPAIEIQLEQIKFSRTKADAYETARHLGVVPYLDGNAWCALYGPNIQEGICGFGDSPEEAIMNFYAEFVNPIKKEV